MPSPSSRRASELGSGLAPGRGAWPESERVGRAKLTLGLARFRPPGPRGWPGGRGTGTHVAAREGSSPGLGWPCPPSLAGAWGGRDHATTVHREVCARLCVPCAATPGAGAPAHRTLGLRDPQAGVRRDPPLPAFWFGSPGPEPRVVQWPTGAGSPPTGLTSVEAPQEASPVLMENVRLGQGRREPPGAALQERVLATHRRRATPVMTKAPQPRVSELRRTRQLPVACPLLASAEDAHFTGSQRLREQSRVSMGAQEGTVLGGCGCNSSCARGRA